MAGKRSELKSSGVIIFLKTTFIFNVYIINIIHMYLLNMSMGQEYMGYKPHELSHNPSHFSERRLRDRELTCWEIEFEPRKVGLALGPATFSQILHSPTRSLLLFA